MRVVGASRHFSFGVRAGAAGAFRARLFHASVAPQSPREHVKLAFFFRRSIKGERVAQRALSGLAASGLDRQTALAHQRAEVHARAYL